MSKAATRAEARSRLRTMPAAERESAGAAIAERVWTLPEVAGARSLLLYASLPEEVPTDEIAREAFRRGIVVTYPRCLPDSRALALHSLRELAELREAGSYGIREPDLACPLVRAEEIDVVLVPGLGWDRSGGRVGRGAGYYDRLFADPDFRAFRCGVFFSVQEFPAVPTDPWDAPLDRIVTELGVVVPLTRKSEG